MTRYVSAERRTRDDFEQPFTMKEGEFVYDASDRSGVWACMNETSWKVLGNGKLGMGYGQKYRRDADGKLWKVEG